MLVYVVLTDLYTSVSHPVLLEVCETEKDANEYIEKYVDEGHKDCTFIKEWKVR